MHKNPVLRPSTNVKFGPSPRPHPQSEPTVNTHTKVYGFITGSLQVQATA